MEMRHDMPQFATAIHEPKTKERVTNHNELLKFGRDAEI